MIRPDVRIGLLGMASWAALAAGTTYAAASPQSARCIDYSALSLKADDLLQDSFSLTVQAAASLLGRRVPHKTALTLYSNAVVLLEWLLAGSPSPWTPCW